MECTSPDYRPDRSTFVCASPDYRCHTTTVTFAGDNVPDLLRRIALFIENENIPQDDIFTIFINHEDFNETYRVGFATQACV